MRVDAIRIAKAENLSEQVIKRRVGVTAIIAEVSNALLGDILVRIFFISWKVWIEFKKNFVFAFNPFWFLQAYF